MKIERKSKCPFILYFILYLFKFQLAWSLSTVLVSYIFYYLDGGDWNIFLYALSWVKDMPFFCCFGFFPLAPAIYYYQCFCMVNYVEIDDNVLILDYQSFFFWNKKKTYVLNSQTFSYSLTEAKHNMLVKLFIPHCNIALELNGSTDNARISIFLRDKSGWRRDQIVCIYQFLEKQIYPDEVYLKKD